MFYTCFNALQEKSPLSQESLEALTPYCKKHSFSKEDFVLQHLEICKDIYFVDKGILRIFYYNNSKEITEWIAPANSFCTSLISYFDDSPSHLMIECLADSEVTAINKKGLNILAKSNLEIANLLISMFAESLKFSQKRMFDTLFQTASQRYEKLIANQPEILQNVPLQHIASYLGISAETLSRIRTKE